MKNRMSKVVMEGGCQQRNQNQCGYHFFNKIRHLKLLLQFLQMCRRKVYTSKFWNQLTYQQSAEPNNIFRML